MRISAIFALVALLEMATFIWVGSQIGFGWALIIALATALLGSYLVRRAGITVWRQLRRRLDRGELPGRELVHAGAVLVAGAFLISPGFITDLLGFLLMIPAIRDQVYGRLTSRFSSRVAVIAPRRWTSGDVIDVDEVE